MKKFLLLVLLTLFLFSAEACDICGCGVGNYYIGILPQFKSQFIGLRYHFNKFNTRLIDDPTQYSNDFYQTVDIWSGWNIGKKFQLLALIPVNFNHQESDEGVSNLKGLGDVLVLMNYKVFDINSKNNQGRNVNQQLLIGGGFKFPTGKFEIDPNNPDVASQANTQLGSGSTDILVNAMYNVRVNKVGIMTQANYKVNSTNKEDYRFGNKFAASSFVSYTVNVNKSVISPNVGLIYENTGESNYAGSKVDLTSGTILQGVLGMEFGFRKISFGFNMQVPIAQNFAENQTTQKMRGMMHVSFVL
jgi:hypothetical protein